MRIVCFGDSITYGFPYGPSHSWVQYISAATGIEMINSGENGDTAVDLLRRFPRDVLPYKPDYTFILIGTNDASIGISETMFMENVANLMTHLKNNAIEPIIGLPIPSSDQSLELLLNRYRDKLKEFSLEQSITCLDFSEPMLDKNDQVITEYYLDEVHPSSKGYTAMGQFAVPYFNRIRTNKKR